MNVSWPSQKGSILATLHLRRNTRQPLGQRHTANQSVGHQALAPRPQRDRKCHPLPCTLPPFNALHNPQHVVGSSRGAIKTTMRALQVRNRHQTVEESVMLSGLCLQRSLHEIPMSKACPQDRDAVVRCRKGWISPPHNERRIQLSRVRPSHKLVARHHLGSRVAFCLGGCGCAHEPTIHARESYATLSDNMRIAVE